MARADLFRPPRQPIPEPVEAPRPPDLVRPPTEPVPTFIESPIDVARTAAETIGGAAQTAGGFVGDIAAGVGEAKDRFLRAAPDLFPEEARGFRPPQPGATARQEAAFGEAAGAVAEVVFTPYTVASGEVIDQFLRSNPVMSDRFAQGLTEAGLDPNDRVSSPRLRFEVGQRVVDEHLSVLWDTYLRGGQDESNAAVVAMTGLGLIKFAQSFGPQLTRQGLRIIQNAPRLAQMIGLRRTPSIAELTARTQVGAEVGVPRPVSDTALADRLASRAAARPNDLKAANDAISQRQFAIRTASREAELRPSAGANEALATARGEAFEPGTGAAIRRFISEERGQAEVGAVTGVNLARAIVNKFRGQGKNVTPELEAELTRVAQKMESGEPLTAAEQKVASGIRQEAAHGQFGVPFEKQRTGLSTSTFAGIDAKTLTKTIQDTTSYRSIQGFGAAVRSGEAQRSGAPQGLIDHFLKGEVEMGLRTRGVSEDQIARMLGRGAGEVAPTAPKVAPGAEPKGEPTGRLFDRISAEGGVAGGGVRTPTPRAPSAEPPTAQGRMPGDVGRVGQPMLKTELEAVKGSAAKQALLTPGIGKGEAATTAIAKPSFPGTAAPKPAEPGGRGVGPLTSRILGGKQPPVGEGPIAKRIAAQEAEAARPSLPDVLRPPKPRQIQLGTGALGRRIRAEAELRAQGQQSLLEGGEFRPAPPPEGPIGTKAPPEPKTSFLNLLRDETGMAEQLIGDKKVAFQDWLHIPLDLLSGSRAIKSSFDLSAYRQAAPLIAAHPKVAAAASQLMIRSILRGGPELAQALMTEVKSGPLAAVMRKAKLEFTEFEGGVSGRGLRGIAAKEEAFPTTEAVQAIPGIRESSRAFTVFLNKMRYDLFKNFHDNLVKSGRYKNDSIGFENELRVRARQLNKATGRGTIITEGMAAKLLKIAGREPGAKQVEDVRAALSVPLNFIFWAPRLIASRVQSPIEFLRAAKEGAPAARDVAAKELVGWVSSGLISLKFTEFVGQRIGDQFPDLKDKIGVEWDLRSPNAYKVRLGDRYYDFWGGAQQIARYATQFATGERKIIGTEKIAPVGRAETALRFGRSKLAPVPGSAVNITTGETFIGEPVTPEGTLADLFAPLGLEQAWESYSDPGQWGIIGLLLDIPEFLGVGVTTIRREPPPGPIRGDRATSTDGGPSPIRGPKPTEAPGLFRLPDFLDRPAPTPPPLR